MKSLIAILLIGITTTSVAFAQKAGSPNFTYDVRGGSGTHRGDSFTEINLGLNWWVKDWLNWRNALFTEMGSSIKTVYGVDTSLLFQFDAYTQGRGLGVEFNAGPGLRFGSEKNNAAFGSAGLTFILGGIRLGGGVQALHYVENRTDKNDLTLPKDEVRYYISISGGGSL